MSGDLGKRGLVVLDRDGVINRDSHDFVKSADEWIPLDGSIEAIAALSKAGFTVAVATNQSGLARSVFDQDALLAMHRKMRRLVEAAGGEVDIIVFCPHSPNDGCDCRKPKPGLYHQISEYVNTGLSSVPAVGDSLRDLQAASAAGCRPILVRTGNGSTTEAELTSDLQDIEVFDDLAAAATALIGE